MLKYFPLNMEAGGKKSIVIIIIIYYSNFIILSYLFGYLRPRLMQLHVFWIIQALGRGYFYKVRIDVCREGSETLTLLRMKDV